MTTIDFIRETAIYMSQDRPDVYDVETAVEELSTAIENLREEYETPFCCVTFTSYVMTRLYEDGDESILFSRKISEVILCADESVGVVAYDHAVDLPFITDGLDDEDFI